MQTAAMHLTSYSRALCDKHTQISLARHHLGPSSVTCTIRKAYLIAPCALVGRGHTWSSASHASWQLVRQSRNIAAHVHATSVNAQANLATVFPPTSTPVGGRYAAYHQGCANHLPIKEQSCVLLPDYPWHIHTRNSTDCQQSVNTAGTSPA